MIEVKKFTKEQAEVINKTNNFRTCIDADGNYYLSIKTSNELSKINGYEWVKNAPLIPFKPQDV